MASRPTRQRLRGDQIRRRCETFKVGFATREDALAGCEQAMDKGLVSPGCHLMPYLCDRCGEWHMRNHRIVPTAPDDLSKHDYRRRRPITDLEET